MVPGMKVLDPAQAAAMAEKVPIGSMVLTVGKMAQVKSAAVDRRMAAAGQRTKADQIAEAAQVEPARAVPLACFERQPGSAALKHLLLT